MFPVKCFWSLKFSPERFHDRQKGRKNHQKIKTTDQACRLITQDISIYLLNGWTSWTESCILIDYPSGQDGLIKVNKVYYGLRENGE